LGCGGEDILDAHETTYMLNTADRAVDQGVSREREARRASIGPRMAAETFPNMKPLSTPYSGCLFVRKE
jgi:hypothetical protein